MGIRTVGRRGEKHGMTEIRTHGGSDHTHGGAQIQLYQRPYATSLGHYHVYSGPAVVMRSDNSRKRIGDFGGPRHWVGAETRYYIVIGSHDIASIASSFIRGKERERHKTRTSTLAII